MAARGDKLYVYLDERRLAETPDSSSSWTETVTISIPVEPNDEVHLLTVSYTTGDSSGRDPQVYHEFIDVYPTQEVAAEQAKAIRAHYDRTNAFMADHKMTFDERHEVALKLGSGEDYVCHGPWLGYFAHLEEIEVIRVQIGPAAVLKF